MARTSRIRRALGGIGDNSSVIAAIRRTIRSWYGIYNVKDYGAVGNGVNNDSPAIQAAANAAAGNGEVRFPKGNYKLGSTITVTNGTTFRGVGNQSILDFSAQAGTFTAVQGVGSLGAGTTLTADAVEGNYVLTMASTAGFAAGDWVKIDTTAQWGETSLQGEYNQIRTLDATTITLYQPLADTYATANTAKVYKANFVEDVILEDFQIIGPADQSLASIGIRFSVAKNVLINNVKLYHTAYEAIEFTDVVNGRVRNCQFRDIFRNGLAYGVVIAWCCQDISVLGCYAENMRHAVTHGGGLSRSGVNRRTTIMNNMFRTIDAAVDSHGSAEDITVVGNAIITSNDDVSAGVTDHEGIIIQGTRATISGNVVRGGTTGVAGTGICFQGCTGKPHNCTITGNKVYGYQHGILITNISPYTTWAGITISGNTVEGTTQTGIFVNGTASTGTVRNVSITGNTVRNSGARGIQVLNSAQVTISGNVVDSPGTDGIFCYANLLTLTDLTVVGNEVKNPSNGDSIMIRSAVGFTCVGNSVEVATNKHGIYALSSTNGTIGNNRILGLTTTGNVCIRLGTASTALTITGNQGTGCSLGVYTADATSTDIIVSNNYMKNNTTPFNLNTGTGWVVANNIPGVIASVASAATITLPPSENDVYNITGTTNIDTITATGMTGRYIKLKFAAALTLGDGTGNLKLSANFVTTADDAITLFCDGTSWYEAGARSVN